MRFSASVLPLLTVLAITSAAELSVNNPSIDFYCPKGSTQPYLELHVRKGLFIKTTDSAQPVSGGTKDAANPFVFKLFDTGKEEKVTFDVWWKGDGEEKGAAEQTVSR
jgi:hypothetical protein